MQDKEAILHGTKVTFEPFHTRLMDMLNPSLYIRSLHCNENMFSYNIISNLAGIALQHHTGGYMCLMLNNNNH